jgi:molecular chaperone GrpE (heat shock protein)
MNTSTYREFKSITSNEPPRQQTPLEPHAAGNGNGEATVSPRGQPTGQSSPVPKLLDGNEQRGPNLAGWIESLANHFRQAVPLAKERDEELERRYRDLHLAQRQLATASSRLEEQLTKTNLGLARVELKVDKLANEIARQASVASSLLGRHESISFNLEQIRTLAETSAQKQQELVDDFIERHVTDHLFKEFSNLRSTLARIASNGTVDFKSEVAAIAEAIESFLAESGLRIINPPTGAAFEPREHQPIKVNLTDDGRLEGTIAETLNPGLSRDHRVLQPARVAVFRAKDS